MKTMIRRVSIVCVLAAGVALGAFLPPPAMDAASPSEQSAADGAALFGGNMNPTREDAERVIDEVMRKTASNFTDKLAGGYADFLLKASKTMDERKIYGFAYREVFLSTQKDTVIHSLLKSYDTFAALTKAVWEQKIPGVLWTVSHALDLERDRLVDFFIQDPPLIINVAKSVHALRKRGGLPADSVAGTIRARVTAAADADTTSDFKRLLYRAAAISDTEVRRVIRSHVQKLAASLTAGMSDNYLNFRVSVEADLDDNKITDPAIRASMIRAKTDPAQSAMMKEYDVFAAKTSAAFDGAGSAVSRAVADALNVERARIDALFKALR